MRAELMPTLIPFPQGGPPRSGGVHLSGLLKSMAIEYGFLDKQYADDLKLVEVAGSGEAWWNALDDDSKLRMSVGLAWEGWYLPQVPGVIHQPGEMEIDGVYMTCDGQSLDVIMIERRRRHTLAIHEVKTTSKSINTVGDLNFFNPKNWMWLTQTMCVHPSTRILTRDLRWVPAGTLRRGDELFAFDEYSKPHPPRKGRKWRAAEVAHNFKMRRPCYELTFEDGTEIICTKDHRWLTLSSDAAHSPQWVRSDRLMAEDSTDKQKQGHRVCKPLEPWGDPTTYEQGWLAGIFDGEGHVSRVQNGIQLAASQKEGLIAERIRVSLDQLGYKFSDYARRDGLRLFSTQTMENVVRTLGSLRPTRLLNKFKTFEHYPEIHMGKRTSRVKRRRDIGDQEVCVLGTTSRTYLAEGFASHNCYCHAAGSNVAYLHILYLYGDYSRPFKMKLHVWRLEFTDEELELVWGRVRDYRDEKAAAGLLEVK